MQEVIENKEKIIQELSRRNAETFNLTVREQNIKLSEQKKRIDLLNMAVANLTQRLSELETMLMMQKAKSMGNGASVK
jgi:predicted nuclease with TOPRIM domain